MQMSRLPEHVEIREQNAAMLTRTLNQIPGITPCTRHPDATVVSWRASLFLSRAFSVSTIVGPVMPHI